MEKRRTREEERSGGARAHQTAAMSQNASEALDASRGSQRVRCRGWSQI